MTGRMRSYAYRLAALAGAFALTGCISLLPKATPVQLYDLRPDLGQPVDVAPNARTGVRLAPVVLEQAAAGDRLLTLRGAEAAYIARARWVSAAQSLVSADVERAFAAKGQATRLVLRGDGSAATMMLMIDVDSFHVRYAGGAPTVEVTLRMRLVRYPDRSVLSEQVFAEARPVASNTVSGIVAAYNEALGQALIRLVAATDAAARNTPAA